MKIYKKNNVLQEALQRIRSLYDDFDQVVVSFSGGKDSSVILNLALQVAKEKDRLPVPVVFIDQEAEWQGTIDYVKEVMYSKEVKPYWYQIPMVMTNNASTTSRFHKCWNEEEKEGWVHPKDKISIKENNYETDRFHDLFEKICRVDFPENTCYLAGVRTEEAPKRFVTLTNNPKYKYITWGKSLDKKKNQYTFYPIYDWSYTDVWKYIEEYNLRYNEVYDKMYRHGVKIQDMRISNLHHETSIQSLLLVQELEPKTWNKVAKKIEGANTIKHIQKDSFVCPKELPYMFDSWKDYAFFLAEKLIPEEKYKKALYRKIELSIFLDQELSAKDYWKTIINTILSSDFDFTKLGNYIISGKVDTYRRFTRNPNGENKEKYVWLVGMLKNMDYLTSEQQMELINYFKNERNKKSN